MSKDEKQHEGAAIQPVSDIIGQIEGELATLALTPLKNIQGALTVVQQNPGNQAVLVEQEAVIVANVNTLVAEAPAALPLLQQATIAAGAGVGINILGQLISQLNSVAGITDGEEKAEDEKKDETKE